MTTVQEIKIAFDKLNPEEQAELGVGQKIADVN
jgi:hypothetical protein